MKSLRILFALVILVILLVFSINNAQPVQVSFFNYQTTPLPLFLILIFIFFLGIILAALFCTMKISQMHRRLTRLSREIEILKKNDTHRSDVTLRRHG